MDAAYTKADSPELRGGKFGQVFRQKPGLSSRMHARLASRGLQRRELACTHGGLRRPPSLALAPLRLQRAHAFQLAALARVGIGHGVDRGVCCTAAHSQSCDASLV